jgi:uncharacterized protein YifE (UPF0438 family)
LLSFRNATSFEEEYEHGEAAYCADRVRHRDPRLTAKAQLLECGEVNHVQSHNSTALPYSWKVDVYSPDSRTVHDLWQEYAYGLSGQEPLREKERRGTKWRKDPTGPKTGKRVKTLCVFWSHRRPIYLFIEMRIAMGDSEAVAVETCQEIVNKYLNRNGCPNWKVLSPLLRGVVRREENAVKTCQKIFNKYLTRNGRHISGIVREEESTVTTCQKTVTKDLTGNGRPISGLVGDQVQSPNSAAFAVHDLWQEYAHGLNGKEPLREKERRGIEWRQDPIDPKTGKPGSTLRLFWSRRRPIYLFIEMRIAMGDSEIVAVEICQVIVANYLTRIGSPNWNVVSPLLRGMLAREKNAVATCQKIFNKYLTGNGRPISGIVADQVQGPNSAAFDVHDVWHEYAHGLNGKEPLREKERRGIGWRQDPNDRTGKRGHTLKYIWSTHLPIYLFIEMRIDMGDSEAVAVEICQVIVANYLTRNGRPNWNVVCPLLRGVLHQEESAVTTCQKIFNKYLTRNGRHISGIVDPQRIDCHV